MVPIKAVYIGTINRSYIDTSFPAK